MPKSVTEHFEIDKTAFDLTGALDALLDLDTRLFIDPHLLKSVTIPELQEAHKSFRSHFAKLLVILGHSATKGDVFWRKSEEMLVFPEVQGLCIGYGKHGTAGSGMGPGLRERLLITAKQIVNAGIKDPEVFELVGLLEENIGADRVSDMTARVIRPHLLKFSQRVFNHFEIPGEINEGDYLLPRNPYNDKAVTLVPLEILRPLPIAHDWSDVDTVCAANTALRNRVNKEIGNTWKYATSRVLKGDLKRTLLKHPEVLKDLLDQYKAKPSARHNYTDDPIGEPFWHSHAVKFVQNQPLALTLQPNASPKDVLAVVQTICAKFKNAIEMHGWSRLLYKKDNGPHHEEVAQVLLYVLADAYCEANNLDLSREANAGRGPVDFKMSSGYQTRVIVEVKLSSNKQLVHGFQTQVEEYRKAEHAFHVIMIVIDVGNPGNWRERLQEVKKEVERGGQKVPEIFDIDGRPKASASKI